jgi:hypothetical protein
MEPVYLVASVPPKVSSPLVTVFDVVGSKETLTTISAMMPSLCRFSVIVGIVVVGEFVREPAVKPTGPMPRMPSTPVKPDATEATPIDCLVMVSPLPRETVSVYSVPIYNRRYCQFMMSCCVIPEKKPEP